MKASLVMRDRETDSWWSIMTSSAISGALDGAELDELPVGEKATWADWKRRHPHTRVLSVEGREHRAVNPYDEYFASEKTFRDLELSDDRLAAKEPVFSFWVEGRAYAAAHAAFEGGRRFELPGASGQSVLLYREAGASIFASTRAWLIAAADRTGDDLEAQIAAAESGDAPGTPIDGFDTFWYTWISVHPDSALLR